MAITNRNIYYEAWQNLINHHHARYYTYIASAVSASSMVIKMELWTLVYGKLLDHRRCFIRFGIKLSSYYMLLRVHENINYQISNIKYQYHLANSKSQLSNLSIKYQ